MVHYSNPTSAYKLAFRVTKAGGWNGDVSVDDVTFADGYCEGNPGDRDACDFEQGLCNFANVGDYQWKVGSQGSDVDFFIFEFSAQFICDISISLTNLSLMQNS